MKNIIGSFVFLILIAVLPSCGKKEKEEPKSPAAEKKVEAPVQKEEAQVAGGEELKDGDPFVSYYPNGNKSAQGMFKDGMMNGEWVTWYENGQMQKLETYLNDMLEGRKAAWNDKGQLLKESWYREGKLHGKATSWDEKGNIISVEEYDNGVKVKGGKKG